MTTHNITLSNGGVKYLRDTLSSTGWAKTVADIIVGGELLVKVVPEMNDFPVRSETQSDQAYAKEVAGWMLKGEHKFEVNDKQRDCVRKCLKHFAENGALPPNASGAQLLIAFGFTTE